MSTEHQQYSTANQEDVIREYSARRGFEIVRTYADEGRSGLSVAGREALRQLIADVQAGRPGFAAVLVYDVSRWGRFQDADESAYYEYLCRRAGIDVHYCAEQFENDGGPASTIIKSVKRAMAGEYSRELSAKVFRGQCRLAGQCPTLSGRAIDAAEGMAPSSAYRCRFGSLLRAYRLAGLEPDRDYAYLEVDRELRSLYPRLVADLTDRLGAAGATVTPAAAPDLLLINGEFTARMALSRCRQTPAGSPCWLVRLDRRLAPDITVLVRMDAANRLPADYYLLPVLDVAAPRLLLCEANGACLDT